MSQLLSKNSDVSYSENSNNLRGHENVDPFQMALCLELLSFTAPCFSVWLIRILMWTRRSRIFFSTEMFWQELFSSATAA
jgi:hypothetical protein